MTPLRVCVFHVRFADTIARALRAEFPELEVTTVRNTVEDPPGAARVEVLVANTFPPGLLDRLPKLRWLQLTGAGFDHLPAKRSPTLAVSHAGDAPARAVAEFAVMGMLALAKQAPLLLAQQARREWKPQPMRLIAGSTLVLLGVGHIGSEIAKRARAFDMKVVGVSRRAQPSPWLDESLPVTALREAAARADYLVIAAPANAQTRGLVSREVLDALKPTAFVLNVGRASILDNQALRAALAEKRLAGALLDVHEQEPLPADSRFWGTERLFITPHCAFEYPAQADDLAALIVDNMRRFLSGQPLRNAIVEPS